MSRWRLSLPFGLSAAEVRIATLAGCLMGLVLAAVPTTSVPLPDPFEGAPEAPDPWLESRRNKEILQAQEGPPDGSAASASNGGVVVNDPWAVAITDGDTFRYRGERIRIADIDTPEVRGRCAEETRLAAQATARMSELLQAGPFELEPIGGRDEDHFGRKLRVVTRDGRSLGDQLVAEGLARTWTGRREPWCPA